MKKLSKLSFLFSLAGFLGILALLGGCEFGQDLEANSHSTLDYFTEEEYLEMADLDSVLSLSEIPDSLSKISTISTFSIKNRSSGKLMSSLIDAEIINDDNLDETTLKYMDSLFMENNYSDARRYLEDNPQIDIPQIEVIIYADSIAELIDLETMPELWQMKEGEFDSKLWALHIILTANCITLSEERDYNNGGYAYVWGGKDHTKPTKPYLYNDKPNNCKESLYGLDCSGFIYQIMKRTKVVDFGENPRMYANAAFFADPQNWISFKFNGQTIRPLEAVFECSDCYKVEKISNADVNQIQTGDIVFFVSNTTRKVYHIGICFYDPLYGDFLNPMTFFESRGNPKKDCEYNKRRGPVRTRLIERNLNKFNIGIIRISMKKD